MGVPVEVFFNKDQIKINIFNAKYVSEEGQTVDDCFDTISSKIAFVPVEKEPAYWAERWADELMEDMWRPGGSIIASANKSNKKISVFNCTTIPLAKDSLEAIYEARYKAAKCAAFRQGLGVDFSALRPRGTVINNSAEESEGVVHWMKSFDNIAEEVGQKGRRPAILCSLKINHPDIKEFITCKTDIDLLKNVNISVQITNDFMETVKKDGDWEVKFVHDTGQEISEVVSATELFEYMCNAAYETGEPGVQFIDLMKRYSIQEALGYLIISTNACSEKPLPPDSVCGLLSANMAKVPPINSPEFLPYMKRLCASIVRFMDNVVEFELHNEFKSPTPEQYAIVKDLREIGLGITNLHQWVYDQGWAYDSDEAADAIEEFFKTYQYESFMASVRLAEERGPCPAWLKLFSESNGVDALKELETPFLRDLFDEFQDLETLYYTVGIRNGALLSIAPTGTLSQTFGMDIMSTGIEPLYLWCYWRKTRAMSKGEYEYYFVLPEAIKKIVLDNIDNGEYDITQDDYDYIKNFPGSMLDEDGSIGNNVKRIIEKFVDTTMLRGAKEIDPFKKIDMMGRVQKWVDAAISVTYNLPEGFPQEDVAKLYMKAYDVGLKAMTVYKEGSREDILLAEFPERKTSSKVPEFVKHRPDKVTYTYAPKRPRSLEADINTILKHKVIIGLFDGRPYECFIVETNGHTFPKHGYITRINKATYQLLNENREIVIENLIDDEVTNPEIKALTRLISSNLRHGVPIDFLCNQLRKCGDSISDYPKLVGRVLKKYKFLIMEDTGVQQTCGADDCDQLVIEYDGCISCPTCGWSKCSG